MAIGSKRIRSSYLSRGRDLVKNFGNKLVQKTISIKDAVPDALSLWSPTDMKVPSLVGEKLLQDGQDSHGNDRNNQDVEQDRLLIPFLVSELKEKTGDFSQIVSIRSNPSLSNDCFKYKKCSSDDDELHEQYNGHDHGLSWTGQKRCNSWLDDYGRKCCVWSATVVGMQLVGNLVSHNQFALLDEVRKKAKVQG